MVYKERRQEECKSRFETPLNTNVEYALPIAMALMEPYDWHSFVYHTYCAIERLLKVTQSESEGV